MTKFWNSASGSLKFDPEALHEFLKENGFGVLKSGDLEGAIFIRVEGRIVKLVTNKEIRDFCWRYLGETHYFEDPEERKQVKNLFYREKSLFSFDNLILMPVMEINEILDTDETSYLFFKNCVLEVDMFGVEKLSYDEIKGHVFEKDIIPFEIETDDLMEQTGEFFSFIKDICSHENPSIAQSNLESIISMIGYLLHRYKDPSNTKAVVLMDPYRGEGANGSSGKSLLTKLFDKIRPTTYEDGKSFNAKDKFSLAQVDYNTRLLVIDDIPESFDFNRLFPLITERAVVERKYQNRYAIPFSRSPKIVITTNYVLEGADESSKRRKEEFIFSDIFKTSYTPEMKYGHLLFIDWDKTEWEKFYILMATFLWKYLLYQKIIPQKINAKERALKMQAHPKFIEFVNAQINPGVKYNKKEIYDQFYNQNSGVAKVELTTFRKWLKLFAEAYSFKFNESHSGNDNFFEYSLE